MHLPFVCLLLLQSPFQNIVGPMALLCDSFGNKCAMNEFSTRTNHISLAFPILSLMFGTTALALIS